MPEYTPCRRQASELGTEVLGRVEQIVDGHRAGCWPACGSERTFVSPDLLDSAVLCVPAVGELPDDVGKTFSSLHEKRLEIILPRRGRVPGGLQQRWRSRSGRSHGRWRRDRGLRTARGAGGRETVLVVAGRRVRKFWERPRLACTCEHRPQRCRRRRAQVSVVQKWAWSLFGATSAAAGVALARSRRGSKNRAIFKV